jgi:hypothetical protein
MSGEQEIIVSAADGCSDLEWTYVFEAIRDCISEDEGLICLIVSFLISELRGHSQMATYQRF